MQDLSHYNAAAFLTGGMKIGPQYARIIRGQRAGTIGQVVSINAKFYSDHSYQLKIEGRRKFWVHGRDLEYIQDYSGETCYVVDTNLQIEHADMLGRPLQVGGTIVFHRSADGPTELVVGTIKRISKSGAVYVKAFQAARSNELPDGLIKVGIPASTMVLDRETVNQILIAKMSAL